METCDRDNIFIKIVGTKKNIIETFEKLELTEKFPVKVMFIYKGEFKSKEFIGMFSKFNKNCIKKAIFKRLNDYLKDDSIYEVSFAN